MSHENNNDLYLSVQANVVKTFYSQFGGENGLTWTMIFRVSQTPNYCSLFAPWSCGTPNNQVMTSCCCCNIINYKIIEQSCWGIFFRMLHLFLSFLEQNRIHTFFVFISNYIISPFVFIPNSTILKCMYCWNL